MSVRSSRSAAEAAQRQHPRLRVFYDAMANSMQAFEKAREWPDLIKCLARVNKVLSKFSHIEHVPMTLTVTKRLAQCLNSVLPGGVHLKTLETYRVILERIGPQILVQDLSLYSTGLFPLLAYASTRVKPELLEIYEKFYLPLGKGLLPCLSGFILALLPGLEEGSGEVYSRTLQLLVNIRNQTSSSQFALALWKCVLQSGKIHRAFAVRFICATIPASGSEELVAYLPAKRSVAIEAIVAALHDENVLTQRSMFDLMISHFPLVESIFTKNELAYLLQATLPVILRRETSVNRRFYSWLLSKGGNEEMPSSVPGEMPDSALEMVITALRQILIVHASSAEGAAQPFNIARTLLERDEIQRSKFLSKISPSLIEYAYSYNTNLAVDSQSVLKSAQLFFSQADLSKVWISLIEEFNDSLKCGPAAGACSAENDTVSSRCFFKIHKIDLTDFALDFLPIHFDNEFSDKYVVPVLIDSALKALYKTSWEDEFLEMTRLIIFSLKLVSRFHFTTDLLELERFLSLMNLPSSEIINRLVQNNTAALTRPSGSDSLNDHQILFCTARLCELFHQLLLHAKEEKEKLIARFSEQLLEYALSSNAQLSCLGLESWIKLVQKNQKEPLEAECAKLTQQLWYLLHPDFSEDVHRCVATLWLQVYSICPDLCEAVAADAMLLLSSSGDSNECEGYERFARLWWFLSPLDRPEREDRCSGNSLSIMLDALDDQRTPIRMIALEFIRLSSDFIYRILDPLLLVLLCPSTLRLCPSLYYVGLYDAKVVRYTIWRLQAIFSSVHRQLAASNALQQAVLNPTIISLLRRHQRLAGNLPVDMRFPLPDTPSYLDVLFWCALRFVQGRLQDGTSASDLRSNEDVRLSAVDLLVQLITASAAPANDGSSKLVAITEQINYIGIAALSLLHSSIEVHNSNMQISLLRLLRHVVIDSAASQIDASKAKLLDSGNFLSTVLYGIQKSHDGNSGQHLLQHWIGFYISILSHLHESLGSTAFSVLTVICEQIRKTSLHSDASIPVLLYGAREIVHFCLLRRPAPLTLASQLSTVNVSSGTNTTVFGFLGGIFSSSATRNEIEPPLETKRLNDTSLSSRAIQGILPLIVDAIIFIWSLLPNKSLRRSSASSASSVHDSKIDTTVSDAFDLIISFLNPLFTECPILIMNALLASWNAYGNDMRSLCEVIDALPAATPDCIVSTLTSICSTAREQPILFSGDSSSTTLPIPSDSAVLHLLDQYIRNCKTTIKLTESWPKLMQLQKSLSGTSSAIIPPSIWMLSIIHEFVFRTTWQNFDPKLLKDIRDMIQNLLVSASNLFVKGSAEIEILPEIPKPFVLTYKAIVTEENADDDRPPAPSWLSQSSASSSLTLRLLSLRSISNIASDILSLVWSENSPEDEERACSLLGLLLPYIFLNVDNRSVDQVDYAAASVAFIASFSIKKFKFTLKVFRKDCWNAFQHNDFFDVSLDALLQWRKILSQIVTEDPTLLTEQLMGRPINPQVLMFTSHKTDVLSRARQLKRLSFMIHSGRIDEYARHLPTIVEKLVESLKLEDAAILHVQVLFCIRILLARVSPENLNLIWPVVLMEVISVLDESIDLDLLLEACKFIDLALVLLPSQFLLYQWMFILDRLALSEDQLEVDRPLIGAQKPEEKEKSNKTEEDDIIELCNYNSFNCFQPHARYLCQRLVTDPSFLNGPAGASNSVDTPKSIETESFSFDPSSMSATLRRPLLTIRRIESASQLKHFHSQVSAHILSESISATPPDLEFIDLLLLSDFLSFGDVHQDLVAVLP